MSDLEWVQRGGVGRWEAETGGGSQPAQGGVYILEAPATAPVPGGATAFFSWSFAYGAEQLDLADPQRPLPLTAGIYSFALQGIVPVGFTTGKVLEYGFDIDTDNNDAGFSFGGEVVELASGQQVPTGNSITFFTEATSSFLASVAHNDTGDRDCEAKAYIQKIA